LLVYNSGRLVEDILKFTAGEGLPIADVVIGGVGTMLRSDLHPHLSDRYTSALGAGYDADRVAALLSNQPDLERQPERYQHALKSSWYLHDGTSEALDEIEAMLQAADLAVKLVYSSKRDLDVLPEGADKGQALTWLCRELDIPLSDVVVAGDTGNDGAMFKLEGVRGIIPDNGLEELKQRYPASGTTIHASRAEADGVIEGLSAMLGR